MFEVYLKDSNKRAKKIKLALIFLQRVKYMFEVYLKDRHKSIFAFVK